ncbi:ABC transporter ATP-binding protein [Lysinibacillus halotolerans]|uniref:ABC transporter ATP-binding protein n=1 Tax=Lysinibacillus halotolerans TaxID=1368476 RepID=A0A3M8HH39_9BACI|nr:ABC transporter ATP-binding protein [Lysinibacillus halotolerans]RND01762.1 ABC transporter ATP-binding protein [Lysinibacillus halotolerans]
MTNAIEVLNLNKKLHQFQLRDVSFTLPSGTIMGFVGENGAGKTTTIKCLINLLKKERGSIKLFGLNQESNDIAIKEQIGVVFDNIHFPEMLTPKQINQLMGAVYKTWDHHYFLKLLDQLKVPIHKPIKQLSSGMKMKLSISTALAHYPKLLILDEPTSGLDPIVREEILDLFLEFMQDEEHSILFSSHITSDLEKIADYITFIHEGEILFSENKDDLLYQFGIWKGSLEQSKDLPDHSKIRMKKSPFGVEILVKRNEVNNAFYLEKPTIEDIMLFYVKGDDIK